MKKWLCLVVLASLGSIASADSIPVTQWAGPPGSRPGTYQEWISEHPIDVAARPGASVYHPSLGDSGAVALYVEDALWVPLDTQVRQLKDNLNAEGYNVVLRSIPSTVSPVFVRDSLKSNYDLYGIKGVLFVGDIQPAWYQVRVDSLSEPPGYPSEWPMDIYYMNLNGVWLDTIGLFGQSAPDGRFDGHTGDTLPQIFVGRLRPPTFCGDRVAVLKNYFRKDNAFRHDTLRLWPKALCFVDEPWAMFPELASELATAYPDTSNYFGWPNTNAPFYAEKLRAPRAWVSVFVHSWSGGHVFDRDLNPSTYYSTSYDTCNPPANFYSFYACSFLRFTDWDSLLNGATAIFNPDFGVGAVGCTRSGGMWGYDNFYGPLAEGKMLGQAFRDWWRTYVSAGGHTKNNILWNYGMTIAGDPFLRPVLLTDVAPVCVVAPVGIIDSGNVVPQAIVKNLGKGAAVSFPVTFEMWRDGVLCYADTKEVSGLNPNGSADISFRSWNCVAGTYQTKVRSVLSGDQNPLNDTLVDGVLVELRLPGWLQETDVPPGLKSKNIKDGGCLAADGLLSNSTQNIYALKGNNTHEFYRYNLATNSWFAQDSIPAKNRNLKRKGVKKGATLVMAGDGNLYAAKGNNCLDWWQYYPASHTWTQRTDVPAGAKAVKEGSGAVAVTESGTNYVYLLKGSGTSEFYRYKTSDGSWEAMANAPGGASGKPFKNGSCLAYDGGDTIYALKGGYNEFFAYSISGRSWMTRETLPKVFPNGANKKTQVKDGAGLACLGRKVYALKGGNTNELWQFNCNTRVWSGDSAMPTRTRKVKAGGALVAADGLLWAFRGNNTREFWKCIPSGTGLPPGQYQPTPPGPNEMLIAAGDGTATPSWSPDGSWVVFTEPDANGRQVFKAPAMGGPAVQLTNAPGDCANPRWSPDGSTVALEYEPGAGPYSEIAVVPAGGGQVTVLTSDACDHENPVWCIAGNGLFYSRFGATTGYDQIYYISSSGGAEQAKTSSYYDHEMPKVLSSTEIICQRDGDDVFSGIYKLNLSTGQEVALTSGTADYSNPSVATGARLVAAEKVDQGGFSQIVVFSADGGSETYLTSGTADFESPSITPDGQKLVCVRQGNSGSSLWEINVMTAQATQTTDECADRESPDSRVVNLTQHVVSATYARSDGIYRTVNTGSGGAMGNAGAVVSFDAFGPNPSTGRSTLFWSLREPAKVQIRLFDVTGRSVRTFIDGTTPAGNYRTQLDTRRLAHGVYVLRVKAGEYRKTYKLILE